MILIPFSFVQHYCGFLELSLLMKSFHLFILWKWHIFMYMRVVRMNVFVLCDNGKPICMIIKRVNCIFLIDLFKGESNFCIGLYQWWPTFFVPRHTLWVGHDQNHTRNTVRGTLKKNRHTRCRDTPVGHH